MKLPKTPELRKLFVWEAEVAQLVEGKEVLVPLDGRNKTGIRTSIRQALLHRGFRLKTRTRGDQFLLRAIPMFGRRKLQKDPTLGPGATNIAVVITFAEAQRLKKEAEETDQTVSARVREMLRDYWARADKTKKVPPQKVARLLPPRRPQGIVPFNYGVQGQRSSTSEGSPGPE